MYLLRLPCFHVICRIVTKVVKALKNIKKTDAIGVFNSKNKIKVHLNLQRVGK